jgi:hypothetical protein
MIGNVPELQEATQSEVVMREVVTMSFDVLAAAPFYYTCCDAMN